MNKKIAIILTIMILLTTGCTKNFIDKETNKRYTSNILCKPESKEVVKIYEKGKKDLPVNLEKLPECEEYKINSGGYEGLWTSIFVKPLAFLIIKLGQLVKSYGVSIMILGILIRVVMIPLNSKSMAMSKNMNKVKPELERIEKKYVNKTDQASINMKMNETMALYRKYKINPLSGCLFAFIQIPLFFAFLEAIQRIPVIFEENLWIFQLGRTPSEAVKLGEYWYLLLVILIVLATYYSFKNMNTATIDESQTKQMQKMSTFMVVFIGFASLTLPTAIALYWIVSNGFTIIQNYIMKIKNSDEPKKVKVLKSK